MRPLISLRETCIMVKILICIELKGGTPALHHNDAWDPGQRETHSSGLGTLPAVSTVLPAWTCPAAGSLAGNALVIKLFLFTRP